MNTVITRQPGASLVASLLVSILAIGPIVFPIEWLFHFLPDAFPVIQHMRGLGPLPKSLWVFCGLLAVAAAYMLLRRPVVGFVLCVVFMSVYVPTAFVLWGQFSFGSWAAIAAVVIAAIGAIQSHKG